MTSGVLSALESAGRRASLLLQRTWAVLRTRERALWVLVLAAFVVDFGLTVYGFRLGLVESNPLARDLLEAFGIPGIVGLKLAALGLAVGLRQAVPAHYGAIVPLSLAIPWLYAVTVNAVLIVALVG